MVLKRKRSDPHNDHIPRLHEPKAAEVASSIRHCKEMLGVTLAALNCGARVRFHVKASLENYKLAIQGPKVLPILFASRKINYVIPQTHH